MINVAALDFVLGDLAAAVASGDDPEAERLLLWLVVTAGDDRGALALQLARLSDGRGVHVGVVEEWTQHVQMARLQAFQRSHKARAAGSAKGNRERSLAAADRLALARSMYVEGMTGETLRRAMLRRGEPVSLRTAERDLHKIRTD